MAIQTTAGSVGLLWSGSGPTYPPCSFLLRFRYDGAGGSELNRVLNLYDSGFLSFRVYIDPPNNRVGLYTQGSAGIVYSSVTLSTGNWYDFAAVVTGTGAGNAKIWVGRVGETWTETTADGPTATYTMAEVYLGYDGATNWPAVTLDGFKYWTDAMTEGQLSLERRRVLARSENCYWWLPQITQTADGSRFDYSGASRNFTVAGSPTYTDGGPAPWGAPIIVPQYATAVAPVLSLAGVQGITASGATPKVTLTF